MEEKELIKKPVGVHILRGIIIGFGLLLLNLIFILGPYVGIWGIIIGSVASGFALIISGITLVFAYLFTLPLFITLPALLVERPVMMLLGGGLCIGLGGVLISLFLWLSKYLIIGTGNYILWHINTIRGDDYE